MAKKPQRPRDLNQLAKRIVDITTGEATDGAPEPTPKERRASKGGLGRAQALSADERSAIAKKAARARWDGV
jgi:hypothetical protein